jgi:hypothetical protein
LNRRERKGSHETPDRHARAVQAVRAAPGRSFWC